MTRAHRDRVDRDQPTTGSSCEPAVSRQLGQQAAASLRRHDRARQYRGRARRRRLGRSDARLRGPRASVHRPGSAGDRAPLPRAVAHRLSLRPLLAARPGAVGPGRQDHRPAVLEAARRPVEPRARLRLIRRAARSRGAGRCRPKRYLSQGLPRRSRFASIAATGARTSRRSRRCARASGRGSSSWSTATRAGACRGTPHAAWTCKDALTVARELERLGVYWMEEPLHRADYAGMRALREATDVRIAGGEMTRQLHELRELITATASMCCSPTSLWSAASRAYVASRSWRRSMASCSRRIPGPTAWA